MRWFCIAAAVILLVLQTASYRSPGGFLGVTLGSMPEAPDETHTRRGLGVRVVRLVPGGSAARAGLKPGDIIVEVEGLTITGPADLRGVLEHCSPGDDVRLTVRCDGRAVGVTATLCARGGTVPWCPDSRTDSCEPWLGVRVEPAGDCAVDRSGTIEGELLSDAGPHCAAPRAGMRPRGLSGTKAGEPGLFSLAWGVLGPGVGWPA